MARLGHQVGIEVKERMIPKFLAEMEETRGDGLWRVRRRDRLVWDMLV